jgi:CDP-diacylglycerol--glycerol-3-phosphate 3-phosphatidyltransferase
MQRLMRHVPNALTIARLCTLPLIVWLYSQDVPGASWSTAIVIFFAAMSDILDGFIARRYQASSEFGLWLDPIVDRLFFFTILGMLWYFGTLEWYWVVPLLVRDGGMLLIALPARVYTSQKPRPSRWGKASNVVLISALQWFIVDLRTLGWVFFAVGATLYLASGVLYAWRVYRWAAAERRGGAAA